MIPRRDFVFAVGLGALAAAAPPLAQQPSRIWRIGFLSPAFPEGAKVRLEFFLTGMRELGYVEGRNLAIEYRYAEEKYERLLGLAGELAQLKVDVLVTHGAAGARAAKEATATVPIVVSSVGDIVAAGVVGDLARPGGNITGTTFFALELYAKRIELLKEAFPRAKRLAFLLNPDNPASAPAYAASEAAAKKLKIELEQFAVRHSGEFDNAFSAMAKRRIDAAVVQEDAIFITNSRAVAESAAKHRLPAASGVELAQAGGLFGYGPDLRALNRRAAYFVDRILRGAKPGELPVERPTRFELVVNSRTAKQIGVTIPPKLLARADRVIE